MIDRDLPEVSVVRQCELLSISCSSVHYRPADGLRGVGSQGAGKIEHTQGRNTITPLIYQYHVRANMMNLISKMLPLSLANFSHPVIN